MSSPPPPPSSSSTTRRKSNNKSGGTTSSRLVVPSMGTVMAAAALAVGTYHVAQWAWGVYEASNRKQQQQQQQEKASAVEVNRDEEGAESHEEEEETLVEIVEEVVIEEEEKLLVAKHDRQDRNDVAPEDDHEESVASHGVRFLLPGRGDDRSGSKLVNGNAKAWSQLAAVEERQNTSVSNPQAPPGASAHRLTSSHLKIRRQRMSRCRDEAATALAGFLSTVRRVVDERTDTLPELRELKRLRADRTRKIGGTGKGGDTVADETTAARREKELWERVKVRSVTKMVASAYAHNLLFLVLTVQVNLLGGRLFEEQIDRSSAVASVGSDDTSSSSSAAERRMMSYQASHRFVLTHTYEHFFSRGMVQLVDAVERATAKALSEWDVLDAASLHFTIDQFDDGLHRVRHLLVEASSTSASEPGEGRGLLRFLVPPADRDGATATTPSPLTIQDELARSILDETWDLLESPVWEDALASCLDATFRMMRDRHWGAVFEDPSTSYTLSGTGDADALPHSAHVAVPLATVLTKLKNTTNSFYEASPTPTVPIGSGAVVVHSSSYGTALEQLPTVRELADVSFG